MSLTNGRVLTSSPVPARAGIGLRFPHHEAVIAQRPRVAFLEVHAENYFGGGLTRRCLEVVRRNYPISLHGVGLSIGTDGPLDVRHLARLAELVRSIEPALISEHLSWSVTGGHYLADLLPLPMTEEALEVVCLHVEQTQERLGRRILLENPSAYVRFEHSPIPEWEFLTTAAKRTGCRLLCDINNIFVSAHNLGGDPNRYVDALDAALIEEIHLAGHAERTLPDGQSVRIDDHGSPVCAAVWALYERALRRLGPKPTLIEWDTHIPELAVLVQEAQIAERYLKRAGAGDLRADAA
jgi:uncharacterized protein (UPF0276 family)